MTERWYVYCFDEDASPSTPVRALTERFLFSAANRRAARERFAAIVAADWSGFGKAGFRVVSAAEWLRTPGPASLPTWSETGSRPVFQARSYGACRQGTGEPQ